MLLSLLAFLSLLLQDPRVSDRLEVHEWGTFTSVAGRDGASLDWRPLAGPSDLPGFVYRIGGAPKGLRHGALCAGCGHARCMCRTVCKPPCNCKGCYVASVRMETPVIYFYTGREMTVEVKVDFPRGQVTEWYPKARTVGKGIHWGGVRLLPGSTAAFPVESDPSHYYPARETDATPVRLCGNGGYEHEKFLFYRGAGSFDLPLSVRLEGGRIRLENRGKDRIPVIVFERRGTARNYGVYALVDAKRVLSVPRPIGGEDNIRYGHLDEMGALRQLLIQAGLYEKEAAAMIQTWRDSWFEEGLRIFYLLPRKATDAILPLTIDPKPTKLVRVLVGRTEIITPGLERRIRTIVERLGSASLQVRTEAHRDLRGLGRFAEPILRQILSSEKDEEIRGRIRTLLNGK